MRVGHYSCWLSKEGYLLLVQDGNLSEVQNLYTKLSNLALMMDASP